MLGYIKVKLGSHLKYEDFVEVFGDLKREN